MVGDEGVCVWGGGVTGSVSQLKDRIKKDSISWVYLAAVVSAKLNINKKLNKE